MTTCPFLSLMLLASPGLNASAQNHPASRTGFLYSNRFTMGSGLTQALLGGFNLQAEFTTNQMVFDSPACTRFDRPTKKCYLSSSVSPAILSSPALNGVITLHLA